MIPKALLSIYQEPKCFLTFGTMGHVDPAQVPARGKPWSAIMKQDFIHKVDLIIPENVAETMNRKLVEDRQPPGYFKVVMALGDILSGDFFTQYVKTGQVLMLSEGKTTMGNLFTLKQGNLTMYLDKATYERAGLVGKPYGTKGARGMRSRWVVSYDLKTKNMVHGKNGFDRLVYAAKKVLNQSLTWLFCHVADSTTSQTPNSDPLLQYFPTRFTSPPGLSRNLAALQPRLDIDPEVITHGDRELLEVAATECYEWFSLLRLESPRVKPDDDIDSYLSRYCVPGEALEEAGIRKLCWQGFLSPQWVRKLLMDILASCPSGSWFCLSSTCFSTKVVGSSDEMMVLRPPLADERYLMWEISTSD